MKVLLLGADTPVGYSLQAYMAPLQRHTLELVPLESSKWSRERQLKKMLRRVDPELIVDARLLSAVTRLDPPSEAEVEHTEWLSRLSALMSKRYFLLSSARVFSGHLQRPYKETDRADAADLMGKRLIEAENCVRESLVATGLVLRLGYVFSGRPPTGFADLMEAMRYGEEIVVSNRLRSSPVHSAEVARVVSGIIDQLGTGAPCTGVYHYCSEGDAGYDAFVEAIVACASQFAPFKLARDLLKVDTSEEQPIINRSLDCGKIRHHFGIQQLCWRDFIERAVRRHIELSAELNTAIKGV